MTAMGVYYREWLAGEGLLANSGCADSAKAYVHADNAQRTMETAKALAESLYPGCGVMAHAMPEGESDPLFNPMETGLAEQDPQLGRAAVAGRIGPDLNVLIDLRRSEFDQLDRVLTGGGKAGKSIFDQPLALDAGDAGVEISGPVRIASTMTENLLLEYTNGMSGEQFAWGRLSPRGLRDLMSLHTDYAELIRRTPYLARVRGSNMLAHISRSLEQAASGKPVAGAMGAPGGNLLLISGHDTNISNLAGILGLSWLLPGFQPNDATPGGALVFSLWRSATGRYSTRVQYVTQSMEQMHDAVPLSVTNPPLTASLFVPGCSTAGDGYPCDLQPFLKVAGESAIDAFTSRK